MVKFIFWLFMKTSECNCPFSFFQYWPPRQVYTLPVETLLTTNWEHSVLRFQKKNPVSVSNHWLGWLLISFDWAGLSIPWWVLLLLKWCMNFIQNRLLVNEEMKKFLTDGLVLPTRRILISLRVPWTFHSYKSLFFFIYFVALWNKQSHFQ